MIKKKMLPDSKADDCSTPRRVLVWRDPWGSSREDQGDHVFVRWGRHPRYDFSDAGAECPLLMEYGEDGEPNGHWRPKDGLFVFSVNLLDHSGLHFALDGDPAGGADPGGFDTTWGAAFLYVDRARFVSFQGEDRWMQVPVDKDWHQWRPARSEDEFKELTLRPMAQQEVDEMNLCEDGCVYGYTEQQSVGWVKTYDDGHTVRGVDWVDEEGPTGGRLATHAEDIDFPCGPDVTVYYAQDVFLTADKERGLAAYEYTLPELVIRQDGQSAAAPHLYYGGLSGSGTPVWVADIRAARVFPVWGKAHEIITRTLASASPAKTAADFSIIDRDNA